MDYKEAMGENLWIDHSLQLVNAKYLSDLGIEVNNIKPSLLNTLTQASQTAIHSYREMGGKPPSIDADEQLPLAPSITISTDVSLSKHGNTPFCAGNIREVIPVNGCQINCLYCLAVSQNRPQTEVQYYDNYSTWFKKQLVINSTDETGFMYYVSPKTEIMSPETVRNGVAHGIFSVFRDHVLSTEATGKRCKDTMFVVTKAGVQELLSELNGESILDIITAIPDNIQINTSLTPLGNNPSLRKAIEPGARSIEDRLKFVDALQAKNILSTGALVEPIIFPYAFDISFYQQLKQHGIKRVALDLLTTSMENLAVINQVIGWDSKKAEKQMWEAYLFTDASPKNGMRFSVGIEMQKMLYQKLNQLIKEVGIDHAATCKFVEMNTGLRFVTNEEDCGCMAHISPNPKSISIERSKF